MKKKYIVLLFLLIFCSQESSIEEFDLTTTSMMEQSQALDEDTTTTTSVEIVQLETFENIKFVIEKEDSRVSYLCLLYTSPSPRDQRGSRMPSSA